MDYDIQFKHTHKPPTWVDGVDRVTAAGDNGLNIQFQSLAADLDALSERIADINAALNDSRRDLRTTVRVLADDGAAIVEGAALGFAVFPAFEPNDISVQIGPGVVGGRPIAPGGRPRYSEQRWTDPAKAAEDGVLPIAPLTVSATARSDLVYADVWEHEAGRALDAGTGSAARIERETAIRVAEGTTILPPAPAGHTFMPIAALHRRANDADILQSDIEDLRVSVDQSPRTRFLSLAPAFHASSQGLPWINERVGPSSVVARRSTPDIAVFTTGFLPLLLPNRARLTVLAFTGSQSVTGSGSAGLTIRLARTDRQDPAGARILAQDTVLSTGIFDRSLTIEGQDENLDLVESFRFMYWIWADSSGFSSTTEIHGLQLRYIF